MSWKILIILPVTMDVGQVEIYLVDQLPKTLVQGCVYYREGDHSGDTYCFQEQGDFLSTCLAGKTFLVDTKTQVYAQ